MTPPGAPAPVVTGFGVVLGAGEWVALTGVNGGGKTSLALALAGLWPASAGTLVLAGRPFGPGLARAEVACVLQDPSAQLLQPTVAEEIAFALVNLDVPAEAIALRVEAQLARFGLVAERHRDPRTLSAGRQQRVLLAAALVTAPRLLIADEPGAHLDPAARAELLDAVAAEVSRGLAVVWVTQDPAEAARAQRVILVGGDGGAALGDSGAPEPEGVLACVTLDGAPGDSADGPRVHATEPRRFELAARGVTALLGANGIGKSVLLAALAGLEHPPGLALEWRTPLGAPPILALQFPELQVFEERVADELTFAATQRGRTRDAVHASARAALAELGDPEGRLLARRTWDLSTGEKRMIEVVAALLAPAGFVALDEPTAGLDPGRRAGLARLVGAVARAGTPVVIASQDRAWVEALRARRIELV